MRHRSCFIDAEKAAEANPGGFSVAVAVPALLDRGSVRHHEFFEESV